MSGQTKELFESFQKDSELESELIKVEGKIMNQEYDFSKAELIITQKYLQDNPDHIFVFGDNHLRKGKAGAAKLRDLPNSYGFITKKFPNNDIKSFYKPEEYKTVFEKELDKLIFQIVMHQDKTFLISKLGSGLANRFHLWEKVIEPELKTLTRYKNVKLLWA